MGKTFKNNATIAKLNTICPFRNPLSYGNYVKTECSNGTLFPTKLVARLDFLRTSFQLKRTPFLNKQ